MPKPESVQPGGFNTLNRLFLEAVQKRPRCDAFLVKKQGRYEGVSSQQVLEDTAALASALAQRGIHAGDRVAILAENRLEWALTDYAVMGIGAVAVPIYPTLLEGDVEFMLRDSEAKGVVVSTEAQLTKIQSVRHMLPELKFVVIMDPIGDASDGVESWQRLIESEREKGTDLIGALERPALSVRPEDTATILYTSGTTGDYKGVVLTHWNIASNVQASLTVFPLSHRDVAISFLPLSHIFERTLDYSYLWGGVAIAYAERIESLPQNLLEVRPTVVGVVPRVLEKILEKVMEKVRTASPARRRLFQWALGVGKEFSQTQLAGRFPSSGLRARRALADALVFKKVRAGIGGRMSTIISGAAPLARDVAEFFYAAGLPVYEGYGLTETSPVIAVNCPGAVKIGTVGRAIPGVEIKLGEEFADEEGSAGSEILVRGPNVTPGYYHSEEQNRDSFVDGWFCTGDLGRLDADGFLSITGRRKHLFKTSGGKYVAPEKLENLFQGHPYIAQIVVLGDGRRFISALIVPNFERLERYARERKIPFETREDLAANPEIRKFMQQEVAAATAKLPQYERIRQIGLLAREFTIASRELSPTQKIKRRVVEERYRELIEEIYQRQPEHQGSAVEPLR